MATLLVENWVATDFQTIASEKGLVFIHKGLIENLLSLCYRNPGDNSDADGAIKSPPLRISSSWRIILEGGFSQVFNHDQPKEVQPVSLHKLFILVLVFVCNYLLSSRTVTLSTF